MTVSTVFTAANQLTLLRMLLIPAFVILVIYGEFGVRLEDCLYIGEDGPHFFTEQSPAIDRPFPPLTGQKTL